jgi:endoglucanase
LPNTKAFGLCIFLVTILFLGNSFAQDYCDVLKKSLLFYEAQRSGRLPTNNRIPWRANSALKDCTATGCKYDSKGDGNLVGGYYDAGDHVKFGLPAAFTLTVLSWGMIEFESAVKNCSQLSHYLNAIKWGTDWFIRAHTAPNELWGQVGDGDIDHAYWGPPETMTMSRPTFKIDSANPGTELAMEAAAALAAASIVFKKKNANYSSTLLTHARQLWSFGNTYRRNYHDTIQDAANFYRSWSGYNDEIVWASAWLYRATGEATYLNKAKSDYDSFNIGGTAVANSFDWDNKCAGVIMLMKKITNNDPKYVNHANQWLNWWKPGGGITYTPGGLAWIRQWGPNRYAAAAAFLALLNGDSSSNTFAEKQIKYMLGYNSRSQSFVVGHGPNYPKNPHHRAAHGSTSNNINNPTQNMYVLTGALVGGPGLDDSYADVRSDYVKNEVALDYNAGFTAALAGLAKLKKSGVTNSSTTSESSSSYVGTTATVTSGTVTSGSGSSSSSGTGTGGITIELNLNINIWWIAVERVHNAIEGTASIDIKDSGAISSYIRMKKEDEPWGAWSYATSGQPLITPISLKLTSVTGKTVQLVNVITSLTGGGRFSTNKQYP